MRFLSTVALLCGLSVVLNVGSASAQSCDSVLQFGVWDTMAATGDMSQNSSFYNWFCNSETSSRQRGTSVGASYAGFGGSYGSSDAESNASQQCGKTTSAASQSSSYSQYARTASPVIVNAWLQCVNSLGSHASLVYGSDPDVFWIYLRKNGTLTNRTSADIIVDGGANCVGSGLSSTSRGFHANIARELYVACRRSDRRPVNVTYTFENGEGSGRLSVPAVPAPTPPRPPVIPDVIWCQPLVTNTFQPLGPGWNVSGQELPTQCRSNVEHMPEFPRQTWRFELQCRSRTGEIISRGIENDDGHWPASCHVPPPR